MYDESLPGFMLLVHFRVITGGTLSGGCVRFDCPTSTYDKYPYRK